MSRVVLVCTFFLLAGALLVEWPAVALAQQSSGCQGVFLLDERVAPFAQSESLLGISVKLTNSTSTAVSNVRVQVNLISRHVKQEPVVFAFPDIPPFTQVTTSTVKPVPEMPEQYRATVVECHRNLARLLQMLNLTGTSSESAALDGLHAMTITDVPDLLNFLDRPRAQTPTDIQHEFSDDLVVISNLVRLQDSRAVSSLLNLVLLYHRQEYGIVFPKALAQQTAQMWCACLGPRAFVRTPDELIQAALTALGPNAVASLASEAITRKQAQEREIALAALSQIVQRTPDAFLQVRDPAVHQMISMALSASNNPQILRLSLQDAANDLQRRDVLIELVAHKGPPAIKAALTALDDPDDNLRTTAVQSLLKMDVALARPAVAAAAIARGLDSTGDVTTTVYALSAKIQSDRAAEQQMWITRAESDLRAGDCSRAAEEIDAAYHAEHSPGPYLPVISQVYFCQAQLNLQKQDWPGAAAILEQAMDRRYGTPDVARLLYDAYVREANAELRDGNDAEAAQLLKQAFELQVPVTTGYLDAQLALAGRAEDSGDAALADEYRRQAWLAAPDSASVYNAIYQSLLTRFRWFITMGVLVPLVFFVITCGRMLIRD